MVKLPCSSIKVIGFNSGRSFPGLVYFIKVNLNDKIIEKTAGKENQKFEKNIRIMTLKTGGYFIQKYSEYSFCICVTNLIFC